MSDSIPEPSSNQSGLPAKGIPLPRPRKVLVDENDLWNLDEETATIETADAPLAYDSVIPQKQSSDYITRIEPVASDLTTSAYEEQPIEEWPAEEEETGFIPLLQATPEIPAANAKKPLPFSPVEDDVWSDFDKEESASHASHDLPLHVESTFSVDEITESAAVAIDESAYDHSAFATATEELPAAAPTEDVPDYYAKYFTAPAEKPVTEEPVAAPVDEVPDYYAKYFNPPVAAPAAEAPVAAPVDDVPDYYAKYFNPPAATPAVDEPVAEPDPYADAIAPAAPAQPTYDENYTTDPEEALPSSAPLYDQEPALAIEEGYPASFQEESAPSLSDIPAMPSPGDVLEYPEDEEHDEHHEDENDEEAHSPIIDLRSLAGPTWHSMSKFELTAILSSLGILAFLAVAALIIFRTDIRTEENPYLRASMPARGEMATIAAYQSYWRKPVREGPDADAARLDIISIPELELTLGSCPAESGVIRVIFYNDAGEMAGDTLTYRYQGGKFRKNSAETIKVAATTGFRSFGEQEAYRARQTQPWTIRVFEGEDENAPSSSFRLLFSSAISTTRQ